jgi:hypothetical protein
VIDYTPFAVIIAVLIALAAVELWLEYGRR